MSTNQPTNVSPGLCPHGTAPKPEADRRADAKRLATLKAAFALRGVHVYDAVIGGWLVGAWNLSRYCKTLDDLEAFARQVGAIR